jgi:pyruvate dehydrogenase E2 component (dihydrolipoamide acetyltransferase)
MAEVVLPELGEGIEDATVAFWHCKAGDHVQEGDDLVELVTDKATFNVPADAAGTVQKLLASEGEKVKIGAPLVVISKHA